MASIGGCNGALPKGARVLVREGEGMPQQLSYELYLKAKEQLAAGGLKPDYAVEQDMELRMKGVLPHTPLDSLQLAKLGQLGYDFVMQVNLLGKREANGYNYVSAHERQAYGDSYQLAGDVTQVTLQFLLYDPQRQEQIYTLNTVTKIEPLTRTDSEGGEKRTNYASVEMALQKAIRKGTEKLLQDCRCCL
ncbi:hypothetical protein [Pontibacter actiniarum]|nr:hypothetical protein [Pontibacter actiniarum]